MGNDTPQTLARPRPHTNPANRQPRTWRIFRKALSNSAMQALTSAKWALLTIDPKLKGFYSRV
ncbi:hypothetical protein GCM10010307_20610 [Streptomyces vastus]|uniref:Transposase n=1 Tax=Streptomyces vastus TaxID=285451 RepID=A0ABN3QMW0_9ACTN